MSIFADNVGISRRVYELSKFLWNQIIFSHYKQNTYSKITAVFTKYFLKMSESKFLVFSHILKNEINYTKFPGSCSQRMKVNHQTLWQSYHVCVMTTIQWGKAFWQIWQPKRGQNYTLEITKMQGQNYVWIIFWQV